MQENHIPLPEPVANIPIFTASCSKPERLEMSAASVNPMQYVGLFRPRAKARHGETLLTSATLYCTSLCNAYFRFLSKNKDNSEAQAMELHRLNKVWEKYIKNRSDKYVFDECGNFFLQKMQFMIGDKEFNEARFKAAKANQPENLDN